MLNIIDFDKVKDGRKGPTYFQRKFKHKFQKMVKGAMSRITHLEKIGNFFQVCHSQSILISLSP